MALVKYFDELTGSASQKTETEDRKDPKILDLNVIELKDLEAAQSGEDMWLIAFTGTLDASEAGWL